MSGGALCVVRAWRIGYERTAWALIGAGFLLWALGDAYYLTTRAEDNRGYVTRSTDGLQWDNPIPWSWDDDGSPLTMSTTAACSASAVAGISGLMATAVPMRARRVRAAMAAQKVSGAGR